MGTRITAGRRCPCGQPAHPAYGGVCEDCWAAAQPKEEHEPIKAVPANGRRTIGRELSGLYYWINDDGATDPLPEPERADPATVAALFTPPPRKGNPLA